MDWRGYCFWASDIPNQDSQHYIIITSNMNDDGMCLVVVISSIKSENGKVKYHDKSCLLNVGDIIDDTGKNIIIKPPLCQVLDT